MQEAAGEKKENGFQLKKGRRFQKYHRQRHRIRLRARVNLTDFIYVSEEVRWLRQVIRRDIAGYYSGNDTWNIPLGPCGLLRTALRTFWY